jgi:hypothetical protein
MHLLVEHAHGVAEPRSLLNGARVDEQPEAFRLVAESLQPCPSELPEHREQLSDVLPKNRLREGRSITIVRDSLQAARGQLQLLR